MPWSGSTYSGVAYSGASGGGAAGPGGQTVTIQGLATAGAYGQPTLVPGAVTKTMLGLATAFAAGLARTSVTIPLAGIATAETVGTPKVAFSIPAQGISTGFAGGLVSLNVTVRAAGFTDEQFGRPPPPAQTQRPFLSAVSAESFGQPVVGDHILVGSALSAETVSQVTVLPGPVTVHMLGEVLTAFGRPSIGISVFMGSAGSLQAVSNVRVVRSQTHLIGGAGSSEAFGQPLLPYRPVGVASAAALGRPIVSVALTVTVQGAASAENVAAPRSVGSVTVMQGAASAEVVSELPRSLRPSSIATSFAAGGFTFYVPPVDQTLNPQAAASAGGVGIPRVVTSFATMQGAASVGVVSAPYVNRQMRMLGFISGPPPSRFSVVTRVVLMWPATSSEAVGLPSFPSPQTRSMQGLATATTFGAWNWTRATMVFPIPVATGEFISGPTFTFGAVSRTMQGAASAAVVSPAHTHETRIPAGVASAEQVGLPSAFAVIRPAGVASAEAVGRPARPAAGTIFRSPSSAAPSEAFGRPTISVLVAMAGTASDAVVAAPSLDFTTFLRFISVTTDEAVPGPGVALFNALSPTAVQSGESFGSPSSSLVYRAELAGGDTAEAFGELTLHSIVSKLIGGAGSGEGFGLPRLALVTRVHPAAAAPSETFGRPTLNQAIRLSGIPSAAAFGGWRGFPGELRVPMEGKPEYDFEPHDPADKYGEPLVTTWVFGGALAGVPSAETVSRPRVVAQGVHPRGVSSQESFGRPRPPDVAVHMRAIARSDSVGRFWVFWGTTVAPAGVASTGALGQPRIPNQSIHPAGAASAAVVGRPYLHVSVRAQGAASSFNAGRPTVVQTLRPTGVVSSSAAGLPRAPAHTLHAGFATSGEIVGRFATSVTVPLASANTGATFGRPTLAATFTLEPSSAGPAGALGEPTISTAVHLRAFGIEPGELVGLPTLGWAYAIEPLPAGDGELVGTLRWSQYPTTGVWIDTTVSTRTQMLAVQGRSMKLEVLAMSAEASFQAVDSGVGTGLLLGATLPASSGMADIAPGSGVGVRYIGSQDFDPASVEFIVDGDTKPIDQLFFFHEDTSTLGAPYRDLDIYWLTPSSFPEGLHTVAVNVTDVTDRDDTKVWQFTSEPPSGGGGPT